MDIVRHRVKLTTITLPKEKGGLVIISTRDQVRALAGKFILWAISIGNHPLQILLRANIRKQSMKK